MSTFQIEGNYRLNGTIEPQGAKNEALQVICATLLCSGETTIANIPEIRDVLKLIEILKGLGVFVNRISKGSYRFNAENIDINYLKTPEYAQQAGNLRGSIMIIGPLLARFGQGFIPRPGGDKIGRRRVDTHFTGLQKLGAAFHFDQFVAFVGHHVDLVGALAGDFADDRMEDDEDDRDDDAGDDRDRNIEQDDDRPETHQIVGVELSGLISIVNDQTVNGE